MRAVLFLAIAGLLFGCDNSDDNFQSDPQSLSPLRAEPNILSGGAIVDAENREVLLRGVNVNAYVDYWVSSEYPTTFPFTESDAELIASIGWNAVRLLLSWSRVEPTPGVYDEAYLDTIEAAVNTLARHGIYSVIDLHQDAWSGTLAARDDEVCSGEPALGWDGAPAWATLDDGQPRCTIAGIRETSPAVRAAWVAFWQDAPGPDGIGIRTRYAQMLGHIAERFATVTAVAGYDVMNEPNAFGPSEQAGLAALYEDSLREIRAAEGRANGFSHLIFFEPSVLWSQAGEGAPDDFVRDANVVYSPHIYKGGFDGGDITRDDFQIARDEAAVFGGAPVFSGEWGSDPDRALPEGDSYFLDHQRYQDEFNFSATLWTWRESCGDPHKTADYRAGRIPEVWGEFDVDCNDNSINGVREDLVSQLSRPALHAAPGRIDTIDYDPVSGAFSASGTGATGGQLLVFYPINKHGEPVVTASSGLSAISELRGQGGTLYLSAQATDSTWALMISLE